MIQDIADLSLIISLTNLFQEVQKTPGGVKIDIVLSPAVQKLTPKSQSAPTTPLTQEEIEEKLAAAANRKEGLEKLRMKNIAAQLSKVTALLLLYCIHELNKANANELLNLVLKVCLYDIDNDGNK